MEGYSEIPLYDKNGLVGYTKVDPDDFEKYGKMRWNISQGYAIRSSRDGLLHRLIIDAKEGKIVDHINGDKLDNRKSNLRIATRTQNAQNKPKKEGLTSKYIGVDFRKDRDKWRTRIKINNKIENFSFDIEEHAAYWYDCLALVHHGEHAKINGIEIPNDFIDPIEKEPKTLPTGVTLMANGTYRAFISREHLGLFKTIEEAENKVKEYKNKQIEKEQIEIERNDEEIAIITTSKGEEILVDDDKYFELIKHTWRVTNNYAQSNKTNVYMHRFIMNAKEGELIDHINHDPIDNRLSNLRLNTPSGNAHNKTKMKNTSSKYIGVSFRSGKFVTRIKKDKKEYHLGRFENEEDAVEAYNKKATELYGDKANLNVI